MRDCPNESSYEYQLLKKRAGSSEAAFRMFQHYEKLFPNQGERKALDVFDPVKNPQSDKKSNLLQSGLRVIKDDLGEDGHAYRFIDNQDIKVESMSRVVDKYIPYSGETVKSGWSDTGTKIHKLLEHLINGVSDANIQQYATDTDIPWSFIDDAKKMKASLETEGPLMLSEVVLSVDGIPQEYAVAGTSDIVQFTNDGRIRVIDFKTAGITKSVRKKGGKAWDPVNAHRGYKAKRYTTQLLGYGRMIESILKQPVSEYLIVPIEVETIDDTANGKYKSITILPTENVSSYGYEEMANEYLDKEFGTRSFAKTTQSITGMDESSSTFLKLTGNVSGSTFNAREVALTVKVMTRNGVKGYDANGQFRPFINQAQVDREAQINQIINEYANKEKALSEDLSFTVKNYLKNGEERFLESLGRNSRILKNVLENFKGRQDITVRNVQDIEGLQDKKNWILIDEKQDGDNLISHLFYIGPENLNTRFRTTGINNRSLFGKVTDELDANTQIQSNLENRFGDARQFEGTMIAMKLRESNKDLRFGSTMVFGIGGSSAYGAMIDLKQNLTSIKNILQVPRLRNEIFTPAQIAVFSKPELQDLSSYRADYGAMIRSYYQQRTELTFDSELNKMLAVDYSRDQVKRKELIEHLGKMVDKKTNLGFEASTDYETYLISLFYLQLQDIDVSLLPVSMWGNLASMPQNIANPILQALNLQLQNAATDMSNEFRNDYKTRFSVILNEFIGENGTILRDYTLGDTARLYDRLFKKIKVKVQTSTGVDEKELMVFQFHDETSSEFKSLTPKEQSLITYTNDIIQRYAKENNLTWSRGKLPLVRATTANKLFNASKQGGVKSYNDFVNSMLYELEDSFGTGETSSPATENIFVHQQESDLEDPRLKMMGVGNDGFINMEEYQKWTSNVEHMLDVFVIQGLRYKTFNKVGRGLKSAGAIFQWHKSNLLNERLETNIDFTKAFFTYNVQNRDLDAGTRANIVTRNLQKYASLTYIGFNPISAGVSFVGNELSIMSQTLANTITKTGGFSISSMTKAKGIIAGALSAKAVNSEYYEKINALMDEFRLFNSDVSSFLNGYHRTGDKSIFRSKMLFSMMNGVDWEARASLMVARMIDDGTWDAYSVKDGELVYEESKDQRFNGKGNLKPEEARALRSILTSSQGTSPTGDLTTGYDNNLGTAIRSQANFILGGFDRETRSMMNARWWGKLFIAMKNWLPARVDRWFMKPQSNVSYGRYVFETDTEGKTTAVWTGEQMEGTFYSLLALYNKMVKYTKGAETKPLTSIQKQNIARMISDVLLAMAAYGLYHAIPDDDDDTRLDDITAIIIQRSMDDLLVIYNLLKFDDSFYTPVPLEYANGLIRAFIKGVSKQDPVEFNNMFPVVRQLDSYYEFLNLEE